MPSLNRERCTKAGAGAFLTLLAAVAVAPGSSRAGCVHDRPTTSHFAGLIAAGAMDRPNDEAASKTPPGRMPTCSGPMCSRGPAAPVPAPWAAPSARDSWTFSIAIVAPASPRSSPLPPEATPTLPSPRGPSVFHPPRLAPI